MRFAYRCPSCGPFESSVGVDGIDCRCGRRSRRIFLVSFNRSTTKPFGRWDPVVGEYVSSQGEFLSKLHAAQERESEKLNMDCVLETVDSRDSEALDELHGRSAEQREADLENTHRQAHNRANA